MTAPASDPPDRQPDAIPRLPDRDPESHKGHFGLVLLVGGSRGMAGAVGLAGMAALRGGAGLVRLAVSDVCLDTVAGFEPSYMTVALPSDPAGRIAWEARERIAELVDAATVVACGPGMGRSPGLDALVRWMYANVRKPMVVDADGLNALAALGEAIPPPGGPRILTPHPGEFARLVGTGPITSQTADAVAGQLAFRLGAVVVLKGHRTRVTNGRSHWINTTGNPGMATGGSGDVLTGLVAALVAQGLTPFDAARLGVHLHGLAGDLAAEALGQESLIAHDLVRFLPEAFKQCRSCSC